MKLKYLNKKTCLYLVCISLLVACSNNKRDAVCDQCKLASTGFNNRYVSDFICHNAEAYSGKVVGDGHCVTLIKQCSNAPNTDSWRPGQQVWKNNIEPGSIIATFKKNRYPSVSGYHAAIYIKQDTQGIWVWDQWQGKPVHKRLIRWRNDMTPAANSAQAYSTVLSAN